MNHTWWILYCAMQAVPGHSPTEHLRFNTQETCLRHAQVSNSLGELHCECAVPTDSFDVIFDDTLLLPPEQQFPAENAETDQGAITFETDNLSEPVPPAGLQNAKPPAAPEPQRVCEQPAAWLIYTV